jgi:hypothetical protein
MKKIKLIFVFAILVFTFVQCGSTSKIMASWVGHTKAELYQSWGPPTRTTSDGQGGEIAIYEYYVDMGQNPGSIYSNYNNTIGYTAPTQRGYVQTRMFYINSANIIYSWWWKGL